MTRASEAIHRLSAGQDASATGRRSRLAGRVRALLLAKTAKKERKGRDSNPGDGGCPPNGFQDRRIQPRAPINTGFSYSEGDAEGDSGGFARGSRHPAPLSPELDRATRVGLIRPTRTPASSSALTA
jgi:hypothetical protein